MRTTMRHSRRKNNKKRRRQIRMRKRRLTTTYANYASEEEEEFSSASGKQTEEDIVDIKGTEQKLPLLLQLQSQVSGNIIIVTMRRRLHVGKTVFFLPRKGKKGSNSDWATKKRGQELPTFIPHKASSSPLLFSPNFNPKINFEFTFAHGRSRK